MYAWKTCTCLHARMQSQHEPLCVPSALTGRDTGSFLPRAATELNPLTSNNALIGLYTCTLCLNSLPTSCSRVQKEQAGHSVHRWFALPNSKFSRHLNKSQQSFLFYCSISPQSANEIQNCGCLIGHCFATLNETVLGTSLSPFIGAYFTPSLI